MQSRNKYPIVNRDISWIDFNNRVLAEAKNKSLPLLERILTLSFVASNRDEYFMVRVASIYNDLKNKNTKNKKNLKSILNNIRKKIATMEEDIDATIDTLRSELKNIGINIYTKIPNDKKIYDWTKEVFKTKIAALLTPISISANSPMPLIKGKVLNLAIFLTDSQNSFINIKLPESMPRLILMPSDGETKNYILLDTIISEHIQSVFSDKKVKNVLLYRILRNAEVDPSDISNIKTDDFLNSIKAVLEIRKKGGVMRLDVSKNAPEELVKILSNCYQISKNEVYRLSSPLDANGFLKSLYSLEGLEEYKYKKFVPYYPKRLKEQNIFDAIKENDELLFHPYDSFEPIIDLLKTAAEDPKVLAIKQTLYRVSGNSPIIAALIEAAKAGKQVTVFIELKARFDEQNNIIWGEMMQRAGCQVIYGLMNLKTHSKITLIIRQEDENLVNYLHLGTGNYHDGTAKSYTDLSLLTCNEKLGNDAVQFFHILTGFGHTKGMNSLITAPNTLRDTLSKLIMHEAEKASLGIPASIDAKMNALVDPKIVKALYKASMAGVKINLIVRSACSLVPGIKDISENITVKSIVGRHLEHCRIFRFNNGGEPLLYLSSADWMPRNLDKRVELMFPIKNEEIRERIESIFDMQLKDNQKSWILQSDGSYHKIDDAEIVNAVNCQEEFIKNYGMRFVDEEEDGE